MNKRCTRHPEIHFGAGGQARCHVCGEHLVREEILPNIIWRILGVKMFFRSWKNNSRP